MPHIARADAACVNREAPKAFGLDEAFSVSLIGPRVFNPALAQVPILVLRSKSKTRSIPMWDVLTSRGRERWSILQVPHDCGNGHRHASGRRWKSEVRPSRQPPSWP